MNGLQKQRAKTHKGKGTIGPSLLSYHLEIHWIESALFDFWNVSSGQMKWIDLSVSDADDSRLL